MDGFRQKLEQYFLRRTAELGAESLAEERAELEALVVALEKRSNEVAEAERRLERLDTRLATLQVETGTGAEAIERLVGETEALRAQLEDAERRVEQAREEARERTDEAQRLGRRLAELMSAPDHRTRTLELDARAGVLADRESTLGQQKAQLEAAEDLVVRERRRLAEARERVAKVEQELERRTAALAEREAAFEGSVARAEADNELARLDLVRLEEQLKERERRIADGEAALARYVGETQAQFARG